MPTEQNNHLPPTTDNTIVYIDGSNFYHNLKNLIKRTPSKWSGLMPVDVVGLMNDIAKRKHWPEITKTTLYMADRTGNSPYSKEGGASFGEIIDFKKYKQELKHKNRSLLSMPTYKTHKREDVKCKVCNNKWRRNIEKNIDVDLANRILFDALKGKVNHIVLISADSDFNGLINMLVNEVTNVDVSLCMPPGSKYSALLKNSNRYKSIVRLSEYSDLFLVHRMTDIAIL